MKYATIFMVVPFVKIVVTDPIEKYLNDLDNQMQTILERKDISAKHLTSPDQKPPKIIKVITTEIKAEKRRKPKSEKIIGEKD